MKSFCPKLITVERYETQGPFKTKLEIENGIKQMQTNEPLNTASIQAFIQQVKGAEASRAKDIRMDITQAKNLSFYTRYSNGRLNGDLEQIIAIKTIQMKL